MGTRCLKNKHLRPTFIFITGLLLGLSMKIKEPDVFNRQAICTIVLSLTLGLLLAGCSGGDSTSYNGSNTGNSAVTSNSAPANSTAKNTGNPQATTNFEGNVEAVNCESVVGWVWDRTQPNAPIKVDIYDGETKIGTLTADAPRQDLTKAGIGNGAHGFLLPIPASLRDGKPHSIWVGVTGTDFAINKQNPKQVTCPAG